MEVLWAPWRMEFILSEKGEGCVFCLAAAAKDDSKNLILHRGRFNFIMLNKYPYNNGHLMVIPYTHVPGILDLSREAREEMLTLGGESARIFKDVVHADGVNCGMNLGRTAGAGIEDHVHFHVVPRWVGDSNFFPVIAETKSMPEYLSKTYDRLLPAFQSLNSKGE